MTPTKEQRQAEEKRTIDHRPRPFGNTVALMSWFIQAVRDKKRVVWQFPEGAVYSPEAFASILASREAAAAYAGAMSVVEAAEVRHRFFVDERPACTPCDKKAPLHCPYHRGLNNGSFCHVEAAKQAADKLKPKGV